MTTHEQYRDDLPLLAAGALSSGEAAALLSHVSQCPECQNQLAGLKNAAAQVGIAQGSVQPPQHLRARILDQVRRDRQPSTFKFPSPVKSNARSSLWFLVPAFAALVLAVLAVANWQKVQRLESDNQKLRSQVRDNDSALKRSRALLETLTAADALHVTLTATGKPAPPDAKTIYSAQQHALVLTANNLAPLPPDRAYQLWLLPKTGAPVPYGTFKPDSHGNAVLVMTQLAPQSPKAFAVTVENEAGSPVPTSPILLVGSL